MIKDTELRKGNNVHWCPPNGKQIIMQVKEIKEQYIIANSLSNKEQRLIMYYDSNDLQPIPITHDLLMGFGFTMYGDYYTIYPLINSSENIRLHHASNWWYEIDTNPDNEDRGSQVREIFFLHQLQNLYYSLTGQELEIKIPQTT